MARTPPGSWPAILDRLETEISLAFAGLASGWEPPADPGPIPAYLVHRARKVLDAQRESAAILAAHRVTIGKHLEAVNSVPGGEPQNAVLDVNM